jgi:hypothetical protein
VQQKPRKPPANSALSYQARVDPPRIHSILPTHVGDGMAVLSRDPARCMPFPARFDSQ